MIESALTDKCGTYSARALHVLFLPIDLHTVVNQKDNLPFNAFVKYLLSLEGYRVMECPKQRSMNMIKVVAPQGRSVYCYSINPREMSHLIVHGPLVAMMDVVFLHWCGSYTEENEARLHRHMLPLVLGMNVQRVVLFPVCEKSRTVCEVGANASSVWRAAHQLKVHPSNVAPCDDAEAGQALLDEFMALPLDVKEDATSQNGGGQEQTKTRSIIADSELPLRLGVIRRFDNLAVIMCRVLQGTLHLGDRLIAVGNPFQTATLNAVVSIRSFPENEVVESATSGMVVGLMTECQYAIATKLSKKQLEQHPFLSLKLGDVLVCAGSMTTPSPKGKVPVTPVYLEGVTHDVNMRVGVEVNLIGHGGCMTARVVGLKDVANSDLVRIRLVAVANRTSSGTFLCTPEPSVVHFISHPTPVKDESLDDVTSLLSVIQRSSSLTKPFTTSRAVLSYDGSLESICFTHVRPRLAAQMLMTRVLAEPTKENADMFMKSLTFAPLSSHEGQRYAKHVVDELTLNMPGSVLRSLLPFPESSDARLRRESHNVLSWITFVPIRTVAVDLWQRVATFITDICGTMNDLKEWATRYYLGLTQQAPKQQNFSWTVDQDVLLGFSAAFCRSIYSPMWLRVAARVLMDVYTRLQKPLSISETISSIQNRWMLLGVPSALSLTNQDMMDSEGMKHVVRNGASTVTLWRCLEASTKRRVVLSQLLDDKDAAEESREVIARWMLAAGILCPRTLNNAAPRKDEEAKLLLRLTFAQVQALYVYQWATRHRVSLPIKVRQLIAAFM